MEGAGMRMRWIRRIGIGLLLLTLTLGVLASCQTTVRPPSAKANAQPVYLIDYGYTSSLALPKANTEGQDNPGTETGPEANAEPSIAYYAYGDWDYYAKMNRGLLSAGLALLWPTRSTLGRGELAAIDTAREPWRAMSVNVEMIHTIDVPSEKLAALRQELARQFRAHSDKTLNNAVYKMTFVPMGQDYHLLHNSNMAVAGWLERLGCEVRGLAILSRWRIEQAEATHEAEAAHKPASTPFQ